MTGGSQMIGDPNYGAATGGMEPGRQRRGFLIFGLALVVVIALLAGVGIIVTRREGLAADRGQKESETFLAAWTAGDVPGMQALVSDPTVDVNKELQATTAGLKWSKVTFALDSMQRIEEGEEEKISATFTGNAEITGLGPWTWKGTFPLTSTPNGYRVVWSTSVIHPALKPGLKLDRTRARLPRGAILGANDQPLVAGGSSVTVGVEPRRVTDQAALTKALQDNLQIDPAKVTSAIEKAGPTSNQFVPVATVPKDTYMAVKQQIYYIQGLVFRESAGRAAPNTGAAQVLGKTGEITPERLAELGPSYEEKEVVGMTGLEARFETLLAGTPSGDIRVVDDKGTVSQVVGHIDGVAPAILRTTLDAAAQTAADNAIATVDKPAAIAVIDKDGKIRAMASRPSAADFDRARFGQYPPGSTFKTITSEAMLASGVAPDAQLVCPPTITSGGRVFKNAEGEQAGAQVSFADAFAYSCNTAFIAGSQKLTTAQLMETATKFGFNANYDIGVASKGGQFPEPTDRAEASSASIGQGKVLASPLHMASVAAAVLGGQWHAPTLIADKPSETPPGAPIDPAARTALVDFMRGVVTKGTGTKAAVPGKDVGGKTGTAEFGSGNPPKTHAWFIGISGDLAVAVVVEEGGFGGEVAAPVAQKFFAAVR